MSVCIIWPLYNFLTNYRSVHLLYAIIVLHCCRGVVSSTYGRWQRCLMTCTVLTEHDGIDRNKEYTNTTSLSVFVEERGGCTTWREHSRIHEYQSNGKHNASTSTQRNKSCHYCCRVRTVNSDTEIWGVAELQEKYVLHLYSSDKIKFALHFLPPPPDVASKYTCSHFLHLTHKKITYLYKIKNIYVNKHMLRFAIQRRWTTHQRDLTDIIYRHRRQYSALLSDVAACDINAFSAWIKSFCAPCR